jgi:exodeoxyribonuclease VII small subunit
MATKKATFEEKEAKLDEILKQLSENGNLTLQENYKLYSEGQKLIKELNEELDEMRKNATNEIVKD